jgi:hypothetical protein
MYRNVICQEISNLFDLPLVEKLYIYFTRQFERAVEVCNSHWFIVQQLCRSSLLCDAHFMQVYLALGRAEFNSCIVWFVIIQPGCFIFFGYSCHLLMSNRNSFGTELNANQYQWFTTCEPLKPDPRGVIRSNARTGVAQRRVMLL